MRKGFWGGFVLKRLCKRMFLAEGFAEEPGGRLWRKGFAEEFYIASAVEGGFYQHSGKVSDVMTLSHLYNR